MITARVVVTRRNVSSLLRSEDARIEEANSFGAPRLDLFSCIDGALSAIRPTAGFWAFLDIFKEILVDRLHHGNLRKRQ
ncbi:hypothetical protein R1flu_010263 [Riccia fluitans]|uniref:Uncharacterized protein n=1 Tax=Riccia fluitans TaxID=41844 RepID=A0ABD1Z4T4_9MARC